MKSNALYLSASAVALVLVLPVHAQDAATPAPAASGFEIEEIIVTAQKITQNIQDVPISVQALSAEALAKAGVTSLDNVQQLAPGLSMSTVGSGFVSYTYVRGSGTNQLDSGSDPSVAFFVDEVYVTGTAGAQFGLYDIERIEVLKGPQGTLFGRNAAAGAVSISTKRPTEELSADATLNVGNYGLRHVTGAVSGPLTDDGSLRFRLSGMIRDRDAITENLSGGDDPGTVKTAGARGQLEYVGGDVRFLLTAHTYSARNGMTNQFMATANKATFLTPEAIAALPPGESFYKHYYNVDGFENQDASGVSGRLEWELPFATLTAISAYTYNKFNRAQDQDASSFASYQLNSFQRDKAVSQEVRLSNQGEKVDWVAGLYYYHAKTDRQDTVITGAYYPPVAFRNLTSVDQSDLTVESAAAFGQGTYHIDEDFSLTAGGRWTRDDKKVDRFVRRFTTPAYSVSPDESWSSFDPSVTLTWEPTARLMTYASWRRGFKSGGVQTLLPASATLAATPFEPETVDSYEVGVKSEWFDRRLRTNIALFRADITDQQILRVLGNSTNVIDNAGQTRTKGVDAQIDAALGGLRLNAAMTYQEARFRRYVTGTTSYAGRSQLRSPDFTGSFGAEYSWGLGDDDLTLRGDYSYQSKTFFDAANTQTAALYQPGFGLMNARLTWAAGEGGWEIAAWARNIGDKKYYRNITVSGLTGLVAPGDPATYGLSLRWSL